VGSEVQPIDFVFADGTRISATSAAAGFVRSPLFHATNFPTGVGQYTDVFQRANFHYAVNRYSPNYHVLMGQPPILPTITYNVPAASGLVVNANGTKLGLIDINFIGNVVTEVTAKRQFDPRTLPMLLIGNAVYYQTTTANCCVIGFHGDEALGAYQILTYFIASYVSPGIFGAPGVTLADIWAPSHELAEWMDDPFVDNATPAWGLPQAPKSCFSNLLEVGDPIEFFKDPAFPVTLNGKTYHPQDLAFFSWLAHQTPSIGEGGRYSYLAPAKLRAIPPPCM